MEEDVGYASISRRRGRRDGWIESEEEFRRMSLSQSGLRRADRCYRSIVRF